MVEKIVIGGIIVYAFFRYVWPIVKIFTQGDVRLDKASAIDDGQYRKLAIGAPYASQQGAYQNSLNCGIGGKAFTIANEWWGVGGNDQAHEALDALCAEGSRSCFKHVLKAFHAKDGEAAQKAILENVKGDENIGKAFSQLKNLKECLGELKEDKVAGDIGEVEKYGSAGWDFGRIVFLARACFSAGYLSEPEAWEYIDKAAAMAQKEFKSWAEFGKSYVIGRAMWGGKESNNSGVAMIADSLLSDENSPWVKLKW